MKRCGNKCLFCFVDQLPRGMRRSLYVKDDDWRMSFYFSNFVTLTNITEAEINEIIRNKYGPLYVSAHCADPGVRARLLGIERERADVMPVIKRLSEAGIVMHAQIVLCPGFNDGVILRETLDALAGRVRSLAVVPVGLTKHRKKPDCVKAVTPEAAREVLKIVEEAQEKSLKKGGGRFVWAADEFYLRAGVAAPDFDFYENFPQIGNGVGLTARFDYEFNAALRDARAAGRVRVSPARLLLATGVSAHPFMSDICRRLEAAFPPLKIDCAAVRNDFFGDGVTVAGLVTGRDLAAQLPAVIRAGGFSNPAEINAVGKVPDKAAPLTAPYDCLLLPEVMLRSGGDVFLDDMTVKELAAALGGIRIRVVSCDGGALVDTVLELSRGDV